MKISVEVNLEDGWFNEDQNLDEALRETISHQVKHEIWNSLKDKVDSQIIKQVNLEIEKEFISKIQKNISDIIDEDAVKNPDYYKNSSDPSRQKQYITLKELIRYKFDKHSGWSSPNEKIEKLAKSFAEDMKKRYDLLFASQLVSKLNDQGLLKEGVFESLMQSTKL